VSLAATHARLERISARMRRRRERRESVAAGPGPLRYVKGERIVDGAIHQVLGCGHTLPARLDADGCWTSTRRLCARCKAGEALAPVVVEPPAGAATGGAP
jgi:hypothetical protein